MSDTKEYTAILIDTSIFDRNGLRLEKGLLGKLIQFDRSPVEFLLPDVIKNEIKRHLEDKIKHSKSALEKAINDAGDHLFFEESQLSSIKESLVEKKKIEDLAQTRIDNFISATGALEIETGNYVNISDLMSKYFSNEPPFAETGKKKNEFPDAITLMAVDSWAKDSNAKVLAVANDGDWEKYCEHSERIDYQNDLSTALDLFNKATAPYSFLTNLETALESDTGNSFLSSVESGLEAIIDGFTPDQEADSHLYWEPEGCNGWLIDFELAEHKFRIIDNDEDRVVLEAKANMTIEAEGQFSLSVYDSIDKDHVYIGSVIANATEDFESDILITIVGDLSGPIDDLEVDQVEIVDPISSIDFGTIEPDYEQYD